jgi:putative RecB family exonuclease
MIGITNQTDGKPAGVAGRDYVSWSQLSTFRQCPLRYQFRYLDRVEPEFVSSALLVGSSLHSAIEHHHRQQLETDDTVSLDELLEAFWSDWKHRIE